MIEKSAFKKVARTVADLDDQQLAAVSSLVEQQVELEEEIAMLEENLKLKKEDLRTLSEVTLPEAMAGLNLSSISLTNGTKVSINEFYYARIPEERQAEAFSWLEQNGFDAIIKTDVVCSFKKSERNAAKTFMEKLDSLGQPFEDKTGVHFKTLEGFVREQAQAGKLPPTDLFGIFIGNRAKISAPKS